jgi:chromate transporter
MHREVVAARGWLDEADFLRALSFCMLLPGPEAMQLATYVGWRLHGTAGGLVAGLLFVAPGAAVVVALSALYAALGHVPLVEALFVGVQAAVLALVLQALRRLAGKALTARWHRLLAAAAFLALFAFNLPFPAVIAAAALAGWLTAGRVPAPPPAPPAPGALRHALRQAGLWGAVWLLPLALLARAGGLLWDLGLFFSKLAVVTFGGAYAVLAWMTQEAVQVRGWLTAAEMIAGLGLAETTPGPLILVNAFVGYLAGFKAGGPALALAGAAVALWMTFAPCFLWIFAGAPHIERLAAQPRLTAALAGITAAVVGVIAQLSLWFALHVLFDRLFVWQQGPLRLTLPVPASLDPLAAALAAAAAWLILRRRWNILPVLALMAAAAGAARLA